jgi:hypothetical protein
MNELERDEERVLQFFKSQFRETVPKKDISKYKYYILKLTDLSEQYWEKYFDEYIHRLNCCLYIIRYQENLSETFYEWKLNVWVNLSNIRYEKNVVLNNLILSKRISEDCIRRNPKVFNEEFWKYMYKDC